MESSQARVVSVFPRDSSTAERHLGTVSDPPNDSSPGLEIPGRREGTNNRPQAPRHSYNCLSGLSLSAAPGLGVIRCGRTRCSAGAAAKNRREHTDNNITRREAAG